VTAPAFEARICAPDRLAGRLASLKRPLVFTNGVFDILHRGHVDYLARARALGASLLVALNSDASARALGKGADRPVNALGDRLAVVAALEAATLVTWFDEDTPLQLILAAKPDILVKGGDWKPEAIVGGKEVKSWGGAVHSIPLVAGRSTTSVIERIRGPKH
jgi:rfaE bifunctional protein nucleotidyltransferase chain/domain